VRADEEALQIHNVQLQERALSFGASLASAVRLVPNESSVLLLLNDSVGTFTPPLEEMGYL
jgi:hypothetical protein